VFVCVHSTKSLWASWRWPNQKVQKWQTDSGFSS
jgi:hypothetical protein